MQAFLARWMPIDASAHGAELDAMNALVHWLMLVLFVGWGIYFAYVLIRFRERQNPRANYGGVKNHYSTYVEAGVAVIEVILLVGFAIPAWTRWVTPTLPEETLQIRVVGEQFAWNVHYPGPDGAFGRTDIGLMAPTNPLGLDRNDPAGRDDVTTINQLHLPAEQNIAVLLSTKDVIHSFSLPQMRVKQDAIPGMRIPVHFKALKTTPEEARFPACAASKACWEIACAQLCGLGHFRMRGFYTVHTPAAFDAWMSERVAEVTGATAAASTRSGSTPDLVPASAPKAAGR